MPGHGWNGVSPRDPARPEPGYYAVRLQRAGAWVPALLAYGPPNDPETGEPMDRSWYWRAYLAGKLLAEPSPSPDAAGCFRIWPICREITADEYRELLANVGEVDVSLATDWIGATIDAFRGRL